MESATKRGAKIIAEYLGGAITCDAHHMTDPRAIWLNKFLFLLTFVHRMTTCFSNTGKKKKVMESLESATKRGARIIAEYLGGAITCDAHHMTDPRADGLGVSSCISKSLEDAGVSPEEVRNREYYQGTSIQTELIDT